MTKLTAFTVSTDFFPARPVSVFVSPGTYNIYIKYLLKSLRLVSIESLMLTLTGLLLLNIRPGFHLRYQNETHLNLSF
jgi:hypothetical protein